VYRPALIESSLVPQYVHLGGSITMVDSVAPAWGPVEPGPQTIGAGVTGGEAATTERVPLGRVAGARSGDKGGNANLGVFARTDRAFEWLAGFLTIARLKVLLPEVDPLFVERYELPNIRSLNFVIEGLLEEGVAASSRIDAQAKSLGEWLRARYVDVPVDLLRP